MPRPGSLPVLIALACLFGGLGLFGGVGCNSTHSTPRVHSPAEEARLRMQFLQNERRAGRAREITHEQIDLLYRIPYRASGPQNLPRVLREGLPAPSTPLGERRSLLDQIRSAKTEDEGTDPSTSETREEESLDPQR